MDIEEVQRHIEYKVMSEGLDPRVAERMLDALADGAEPDYASLLERATFIPPPPRCYHTAPTSVRGRIAVEGLLPGTGQNWKGNADGQPEGVYVGPKPDLDGIWAHWPQWDVWEVDMAGLVWFHDRLNPGCWSIVGPVPPDHLTLLRRD